MLVIGFLMIYRLIIPKIPVLTRKKIGQMSSNQRVKKCNTFLRKNMGRKKREIVGDRTISFVIVFNRRHHVSTAKLHKIRVYIWLNIVNKTSGQPVLCKECGGHRDHMVLDRVYM